MNPEDTVSSARRKALISDFLLLLAAMTWGGEYVVAKSALSAITPIWLNAFRFGFGWCILAIFLHRKLVLIRLKELKAGLVAGIFMFGGFCTQMLAINYTSASNAAFLTTAYVVIIPMYVWVIYKRRPGKFTFIAALICIFGVGLLSLHGNFHMGLGDGLAIAAAALFAADICSVEFFIKRGMDPLVMTLSQMGFVAAISLTAAFIFEPVPAHITRGVALSVVYMVLLGAIFTQVVFNVAMKHTTSTKASIINSMEAVFGLIFSVIFLGDAVTFRGITGGFCIVGAIIIAETELQFMRPLLQKLKLVPAKVETEIDIDISKN